MRRHPPPHSNRSLPARPSSREEAEQRRVARVAPIGGVGGGHRGAPAAGEGSFRHQCPERGSVRSVHLALSTLTTLIALTTLEGSITNTTGNDDDNDNSDDDDDDDDDGGL